LWERGKGDVITADEYNTIFLEINRKSDELNKEFEELKKATKKFKNHRMKKLKNIFKSSILSLVIISLGLQAQNQEKLILQCPMDDVGLTAIYKLNFEKSSVELSMKGFGSSQTYSFTIKGNKVYIPPSEFGEEIIDLSLYEVSTRAGFEGASWKAYKCSKI